VGILAGFASAPSLSEPVGVLAGFGGPKHSRHNRATVSRCTPVSLATRRKLQPRRNKANTVSCSITLRTFIAPLVAGFHMPINGRFWMPTDMKQLEEENVTLKRLVADLSLDKHMLQEVIAKKL
jgi:hypothetical protein